MPTNAFVIGERVDKRTKYEKHFLMSDGSFQMRLSGAPVHYQDDNGQWHNIDTDLFDEADFDMYDGPVCKHQWDVFKARRQIARGAKEKRVLDRNTFDFHALRLPFAVMIPRNFKKGYSIGKGENKLQFIPVGASVSIGRLNENDRSIVEYQDAWNDTDVTLKVTDLGVKETIILKTDRAPVQFSFEVKGPLADDLRSGEMFLQNAWLQDANGVKRDVSQTVRRAGGRVYIDLSADITGLTYPIEIDPTVEWDGSSYVYDACVNDYSPTSVDSTGTSIRIGMEDISGSGDGVYRPVKGYIRFSGWSIPAGATVQKAELSLWALSSYGSVDFWEGTKTSLTNYSDPQGPYVAFSGFTPNAESLINITSLFLGWHNGSKSNNGIMMTGASNDFAVCSTQHATTSRRPALIVQYNTIPTAPTVISPNGGEVFNAVHAIRWTAGSDSPDDTYFLQTTTQTSTVIAAAAGNAYGQIVTSGSADPIRQVKVRGASGITGMSIEIRSVSGNTAGGIVYDSGAATHDGSYYVFNLNKQVSFAPGTQFAIQVNVSAGAGNLYGSTSNAYSGGNFYANGVADTTKDLNVAVQHAVNNTFDIRYQIQLSTNGGSTWKDIVSLTGPGATSYAYNFINEPETATAKIRIRAYDGASYSAWDESNAVFTIDHNLAPTAPTNLSPNGSPVDRAQVQRLSWQHNDPNGTDPQSKADLQWRQQGAGSWNSVTIPGSNNYWDAPANTFPYGSIEWQVRTYDQDGVASPYSAQVAFFAGNKPTQPVISSPVNGANISSSRPAIQWTSLEQTKYQARAVDAFSGQTVWDSGEVNSPVKAATIGVDLTNGKSYRLEVRIKNADGLWSSWASITVNVNYTTPPRPILTIYPNAIPGALRVAVENPAPVGSEPSLVTQDLYRRTFGQNDDICIARSVLPNHYVDDYSVASGTRYEYYMRATGDNASVVDSLPATSECSLVGVWIHDVNDPARTCANFKFETGGRAVKWETNVTLMQFAGRTKPVADVDETDVENVETTLRIVDDGLYQRLLKLIRRKSIVCYRDGRGRKVYGIIDELPTDDQRIGYSARIRVNQVDFSEGV